jgi:hypothetical protein
MEKVRYCTPEWLEENMKRYSADPKFQESLKTFTHKLVFRVKADSSWGIVNDILFCAFLEQGKMTRLGFLTEAEALKEASFVLSATPQEWKKILRKESKFATDFMLGKITLEYGDKAKVFAIAPHADKLVKAITQVEILFPDEMTPAELAAYVSHIEQFRAKLGV